jgi:hypothetical protein
MALAVTDTRQGRTHHEIYQLETWRDMDLQHKAWRQQGLDEANPRRLSEKRARHGGLARISVHA